MKRMKKLLSVSLAAALALSLLGPMQALAATTFRDIRGHWAEEFIKDGVSHGYINGYEDGTFKPNTAVTRAEFCKMVNNALDTHKLANTSLSDVKTTDWFYSEVRKAVSAGYINGYEDSSFRANNQITRQEAAVIIARIMTPPSALDNLDVMTDRGQIASWALNDAKAAYAKGYMTGDENRQYRPLGNLTRAEAAKIIESILDTEQIVTADMTVSTSSAQSYSKTLYVGDVTLAASLGSSGTIDFTNCRVLGTLAVSGGDTVNLNSSGVNQLDVSAASDRAEVRLGGLSSVKSTTVGRGCTLTEKSLTGTGFTDVQLYGSGLKDADVYMDGDFTNVTVKSPTHLTLTGGNIVKLQTVSGASGAKIYLSKDTRVQNTELSADCDFTGSGRITKATVNGCSVSFETQPDSMSGQGGLVPAVSPKDGATDVALSGNITLTFDDALYNSAGKSLTAAMVEDVVQLRRGSESGPLITCEASISSSRKVITLNPDDNLRSDTKYYIILLSRSLQNSAGQVNSKQVFTFDTSGGTKPVTNPADGGDMAPVSGNITISFPQAMYESDGGSISASYIQDYVTLRKSSSSGTAVPFTASISSDRKTITLDSKSDLSLDTRYYVTIPAGTFQKSDEENSPLISFSFTTADSDVLVPTIDPPSGSKDIDPNSSFTLSFDTTLYTGSGSSAVTTSYLEEDAFTLRRDSSTGSAVSFSASIDQNRQEVTIEPDSSLREDTDYYLIVESGALADGSGSSRNANDKLVFHFATGTEDSILGEMEPSVSPKNGATGIGVDTSIVLSFDERIYNASGNTPSASYLQDCLELRRGSATGAALGFTATLTTNSSITIKPTGTLAANTGYYVILGSGVLQNIDGVENSRFSSYFTTGTGSALAATISPANGATGVSPTGTIALSFSSTPYTSTGATLRSAYVESTAVKLYEGSISTSNSRSFTATVSGRNISIVPTVSMTQNKLYYVVIVQNSLSTADSVKNSEQRFSFTVGSGLSMTVTPANNATGVSRSGTIRLAFNERLYYSGSTVLNMGSTTHVNYVKNNITLTGSGNVSYTPSLSGNTLILTPDSPMASNTRHTITVKAGFLRNASGGVNAALTSYFTTDNTQAKPTMDLMGESLTAASVQPNIRLTFQEAVTKASVSTLQNADVLAAVRLRRSSSTGTLVDCSATIATDRKSFTIKPLIPLNRGETYYVVLQSGTIQGASGVYGQEIYSFTVESITPVTVQSISPSGTNVDFGVNKIVVTFNTLVTDNQGKTLTAQYVLDNCNLWEGSTNLLSGSSSVSITVGTSSGKTTLTFTLPSGAVTKPNTAYTLQILKDRLKNASGGSNSAIEMKFTTKKPTVSLSADYKPTGGEKYSATIQISSDCNVGTYNITVGGAPVYSGGVQSSVTVSGLEAGTHLVELDYNYLTGTLKQTFSLQITPPSDDATLSTLRVNVDGVAATVSQNGTSYQVTGVIEKSGVVVIPTATHAKATITVDGTSVASGSAYSLPMPGVSKTLTIVVTAESGTTRTYTLTLAPAIPSP